ncbi:hypothetical protein HYFRA_00005624 [Hymenoscyphus fraxineus]|uniref:F5/8 type C domain-containing protein n=1 Tax=Hymenoscyphus fraxineus TaxID=746836 RepID=A0A9N9KPT7_9HELO|nr:hypothetical protein HYFRA_00005624 [Hymenoscyphus fraxineus]
MQSLFVAWNDSFDASKGLYYVEPLRDATEYSIASIDASGGQDGFRDGEAFRPSINSYQFSNAKAIANIAALNNLTNITDEYNKYAANIKQSLQSQLWNSTYQHFIDRFQVQNDFVKYFDFIRGRELVGYVPWAHDLPDDNKDYAQAWRHILDTNELRAPYGLRTVEPSYEYYMRQYRYEGTRPECQWNGPIWPFHTTLALTGLGNFLDHYNTSGIINTSDFVSLLRNYTQLHYNHGILNLQENYDPATGNPIVGLDRSPHYFHSGYVDIILNHLVGIRARADDTLEINPLVDESIAYFRVEKVPYHGQQISVQWDSTGNKYGAVGLVVEVNDLVVATQPNLERLVIPVARIPPPEILRPISKSTQPQTNTPYPRGNVSIPDQNMEQIHDVIDGRVQFFTEYINGWTTPVGNGVAELWYQVDFGNATEISRAEIAWFGDSGTFDVPTSYKIQVSKGWNWTDVSNATYAPSVSSGITHVSWGTETTQQVRLVFVPKNATRSRLVEFTLF